MISRQLQFLVCGVISCFFSGCEKEYRSYAEIELINGQFVTPLGAFNVNLLSSVNEKLESKDNKRHKDNFTLFSSDGLVTIDFGTAEHVLHVNTIRYHMSLGKTLNLVSIKYHMNGEAYATSFEDPSKSGNGYLSDKSFYQSEMVDKRRLANLKPITRETYYYSINFPVPLQNHSHSVDAESYKKHNSRVHKVQMEFLLEDKRYTFYAEYKHVLTRESYYPSPYGGVSP
jgi:hypothetical protein